MHWRRGARYAGNGFLLWFALWSAVAMAFTGRPVAASETQAAVRDASSVGVLAHQVQVLPFGIVITILSRTLGGGVGGSGGGGDPPSGDFPEPFLATLPNGVTWDTSTGAPTGNPTGVTTTMPAFAGTNRNASTAAEVLTAWNASSPGDTITITADFSTSSSIQLSSRGFTAGQFVQIRSDGHASLPTYGPDYMTATKASNRVDQTTHAAALRTLTSTATNTPLFRFTAGAGGVWFTGLDLTCDSAVDCNDALIKVVGHNDHNSEADMPHDVVIDRCVLRAQGDNVRRAVQADCDRITISGSQLLINFDPGGSESQGIGVFEGGRFGLIYNNTIQAQSINILFGGADPDIQDFVHSDFLVVRNEVIKDPTWTTQNKNWFEMKIGARVAHCYNVCRYFNQSAQQYVVITNVANTGAGAPWAIVTDVLYWGNRMYEINGGVFDFSAGGSNTNPLATNLGTHKIEFAHNVAEDVIAASGTKNLLIPGRNEVGFGEVAIYHNILGVHNAACDFSNVANYLPADPLYFCDNIFSKDVAFGPLRADGGAEDSVLLDAIYTSGWTCRNNWKKGSAPAWDATLAGAPHSNQNFINDSDIFTDAANDDFSVPASSAAYQSCQDGFSPGPLYTMVDTHTAGVE